MIAQVNLILMVSCLYPKCGLIRLRKIAIFYQAFLGFTEDEWKTIHIYFLTIVNSTLLFILRVSSELFLAIGFMGPQPFPDNLFLFIPLATM